jgi:hypothetical protein
MCMVFSDETESDDGMAVQHSKSNIPPWAAWEKEAQTTIATVYLLSYAHWTGEQESLAFNLQSVEAAFLGNH